MAFCFVAVHADAYSKVLENFPVRIAAAEFIIGDDFLRAGMNDVELNIPDRTICRRLELEHRIALAGILPVLQHPSAAAIGSPSIFPENKTPLHKIIYFCIQTLDNGLARHPNFSHNWCL